MDEFEQQLVKIAKEVRDVLNSGGHLVFADETIFNARDFQMKAWSLPRTNVRVDDRTGNQPCLAVCAAVCKCHGLLAFTIEEQSYDAPKFKNFLQEVRSAAGNDKIYMFLDNCKVHKARELKDEWQQLDIKPIWNVPYAPQYNAAIELYWAQLKVKYKPLLLKKMLDVPRARDKPMVVTVHQVIKENDGFSIPAFIDHGLRNIFTDANAAAENQDMADRFDVELQELEKQKQKAIENLPDTGLRLADLDKDLPPVEKQELQTPDQSIINP